MRDSNAAGGEKGRMGFAGTGLPVSEASKEKNKAVSALPIRPLTIDCDWSRMRQSQKRLGRGTGKCLKGVKWGLLPKASPI